MNWVNPSALRELSLRFALDLVVIVLLVRGVYHRYSPNNEFSFTYILFNILIFFVCYLMSGLNLDLGFGFGLFAMFGILRYRTITLSIKEMTYLLAVIVLAVTNALNAPEVSFSEIAFINIVIVGFIFLMEHLWFKLGESSQMVNYEKIELITPERRADLLADLQKRTGLPVHRVEIEQINFLSDSALLRAYYIQKN